MDSSRFAPRGLNKWQNAYQSAVFEPDNRRLFDRIDDARAAILNRVETLPARPSTEERRALRDALRSLELLEGAAHRQKTVA